MPKARAYSSLLKKIETSDPVMEDFKVALRGGAQLAWQAYCNDSVDAAVKYLKQNFPDAAWHATESAGTRSTAAIYDKGNSKYDSNTQSAARTLLCATLKYQAGEHNKGDPRDFV